MLIKILLASYREVDLLNTIKSALQNAAYPDDIGFSIIWQGSDEESYQLKEIEDLEIEANVTKHHYTETQGTGWARSQHVIDYEPNDEYALQVDAHSRFFPEWDKILIDQYHSCNHSKPVLSAYPCAFDPYNNDKIDENAKPYRVGINSFHQKPDPKWGLIWHQAINEIKSENPVKGYLVSCGLIFSSAKCLMQEVITPSCIFHDGEEYYMSANFFDKRYQVFHPSKLSVAHNYSRRLDNIPRFIDFDLRRKNLEDLSYNAYRDIFGIDSISNLNYNYDKYKLKMSKKFENILGIDSTKWNQPDHIPSNTRNGIFE